MTNDTESKEDTVHIEDIFIRKYSLDEVSKQAFDDFSQKLSLTYKTMLDDLVFRIVYTPNENPKYFVQRVQQAPSYCSLPTAIQILTHFNETHVDARLSLEQMQWEEGNETVMVGYSLLGDSKDIKEAKALIQASKDADNNAVKSREREIIKEATKLGMKFS